MEEAAVTITRKIILPDEILKHDENMSYTNANSTYIQELQRHILNRFLLQSSTQDGLPSVTAVHNAHNSLLQLQLLAQTAVIPELSAVFTSEIQQHLSHSQLLQVNDTHLSQNNKIILPEADKLSPKNACPLLMNNFFKLLGHSSGHMEKVEISHQFLRDDKGKTSPPPLLNISDISTETCVEQNEPIDLSVRRDSEEIIDVIEPSSPPKLLDNTECLKLIQINKHDTSGTTLNMESFLLTRSKLSSCEIRPCVPDMIPISDLNHNSVNIAGCNNVQNKFRFDNSVCHSYQDTDNSVCHSYQDTIHKLSSDGCVSPTIDNNTGNQLSEAVQKSQHRRFLPDEGVSNSLLDCYSEGGKSSVFEYCNDGAGSSVLECCMTVSQVLPGVVRSNHTKETTSATANNHSAKAMSAAEQPVNN